MTDEKEKNPLGKLIRQPQIYVRLPSGGRYNKNKIDFTATGEVPVRALTARDNLLLKNPDALLNGDAVEGMIRSCVPEIHNAKETPMNDIDLLILAIKYASSGDKFEFKTACPKCGTEHNVVKSIRAMIESATEVPELNSVKFEEEDKETHEKLNIEIILRPYTFENHLRANMADFESQKRLGYVRTLYDAALPEIASDEEKIKRSEELEKVVRGQMKEIFTNMADLTLHLMIESVSQINLTSEKTGVKVITDREFIKEYIWNLDDDKNSVIKAKMKEVMSYGVDKKVQMVCVNPECKHEWVTEVGYDHSNFFVTSS